ncbi:MAG TPA: hypothetical protein VLM40_01150, partial [Gemmata sp.]|nr:hypothetical protein [Gemmata sp.]
VFDRDTRTPEIHVLGPGPAYGALAPDADGWLKSPATGVEFRQTQPGTVRVRIGADDATAKELGGG